MLDADSAVTATLSPHPAGSRRPLSAFWKVLFSLAGFLVFEWLIGQVASPFQGADKVERKFAYFAAHKDEFDHVFIGSSRVMNQLSPRVFDSAMAAAGQPCHSFNLGNAAMFLPECSFLLEQVIALHPAHLRVVVMELSSPTPRDHGMQPLMAREVYWRHLEPTALVCATILNGGPAAFGKLERREILGRQLLLMGRSLLHLGTGADLFDHLRRVSRRPAQIDRQMGGPDRDGFIPLQTTLGHGKTGVFKTGGSEVDLHDFERSAVALQEESASASPVAAGSQEARAGRTILRTILARQIARLRKEGITLVGFIGPGTTREQEFLDLQADGTLPALLAFNDPAAYPDLYRPELRADRYHLNGRGADVLTRLLAKRLSTPSKNGG